MPKPHGDLRIKINLLGSFKFKSQDTVKSYVFNFYL